MIPKVSKVKGDYRIEQTAHLIRMRGLFFIIKKGNLLGKQFIDGISVGYLSYYEFCGYKTLSLPESYSMASGTN